MTGRATAGPAVLLATPAGLSITGPVGQRVRRHVQLVAQGDTSLALDDITLTGADTARFALPAGGGCAVGTALAPATGCTLMLDSTPARGGLHQAALRVQPGGGAAAIEIPLAALSDGAPATALLQVDVARLDFGRASGRRRRTAAPARDAGQRRLGAMAGHGDRHHRRRCRVFRAGRQLCRGPAAGRGGARCTVEAGSARLSSKAPSARSSTT